MNLFSNINAGGPEIQCLIYLIRAESQSVNVSIQKIAILPELLDFWAKQALSKNKKIFGWLVSTFSRRRRPRATDQSPFNYSLNALHQMIGRIGSTYCPLLFFRRKGPLNAKLTLLIQSVQRCYKFSNSQ